MSKLLTIIIVTILISGCKSGGGGGASTGSVSHFASIDSGVSTGSGGADSAIYGLKSIVQNPAP